MDAHPAANVFPLLSDSDLEELASDISAHGLLHPIITYQGQILDGRNRLAACELASVKPRFEEWTGKGSPTDFVLSVNLHRRHLTAGQRAMIADDVRPLYEAEAREAQNKGKADLPGESQEGRHETARRAAEQVGAATREVYRAASLKQKDPELAQKVRDGEMSMSTATRVIASRDKPTEAETRPAAAPTGKRATESANAHKRRLDLALATMIGTTDGMEVLKIERLLSVATREDVTAWRRSIAGIISTLRNLDRSLRME